MTANVQQGDTLSIPEYGVLLQITSITVNSAAAPTVVTVNLASPGLLPAFGMQTAVISTTFGFIRKARPMIGEPILQLTADNAIDGNANMSQADVDPSGTFFDVLFAPNGEVLNTTRGKTILWVRNPTIMPGFTSTMGRPQYEQAGSMNLVTVYSKTGAIATQPVTLPPNPDPFAATKDGFNTGL